VLVLGGAEAFARLAGPVLVLGGAEAVLGDIAVAAAVLGGVSGLRVVRAAVRRMVAASLCRSSGVARSSW
jgi:hypothetical protein